MRTLLLPLQPRFIIYTLVVLIAAALGLEFFLGLRSLLIDIPLVVFISLAVIGTVDVLQTRHAVLRNYPLSAHIRFILEEIRPEIRQYFLESEKDGTPFSRDKRALVYQRAKRALDKRPFGTQNDVYASGLRMARSLDRAEAGRQGAVSHRSSAGRIAPSPIRHRSSIFRR